MEIWSFIEVEKKKHIQKNQAVYIENSRHFLVKRVLFFCAKTKKKSKVSLKNCRLCSSLSVPVYYNYSLPYPSLPSPKKFGKKMIQNDAATFKVPPFNADLQLLSLRVSWKFDCFSTHSIFVNNYPKNNSQKNI